MLKILDLGANGFDSITTTTTFVKHSLTVDLANSGCWGEISPGEREG